MAQKPFDDLVHFVPFSRKRKLGDWIRRAGYKFFGHPLLAFFMHIHVMRGDQVLYDQAVLIERGGSGTVIVDEYGHIGLVTNFRPVPKKKDWSLWKTLTPSDLGRPSPEIPRGFREDGESGVAAALREAFEEAGVTSASDIEVTQLGDIVSNTTFVVQYIELYLLKVRRDHIRENLPDNYESLLGKLEWHSLEEIQEMINSGELFCGITLAAIGQYLLGLQLEQAKAAKLTGTTK